MTQHEHEDEVLSNGTPTQKSEKLIIVEGLNTASDGIEYTHYKTRLDDFLTNALRSHAAIVEAETVERCARKIKEMEESKREEYRECGGQMLQGEVFGLKSAATAIRSLASNQEKV